MVYRLPAFYLANNPKRQARSAECMRIRGGIAKEAAKDILMPKKIYLWQRIGAQPTSGRHTLTDDAAVLAGD